MIKDFETSARHEEQLKKIKKKHLAESKKYQETIKHMKELREETYERKNEELKEIIDYVSSITNQKGERYYMMTYHFYIKMDTEYYNKQYEENPLKYNLRKFGDAFIGLSEEELTEDIINVIQENLEFSQELGFRDYVFDIILFTIIIIIVSE